MARTRQAPLLTFGTFLRLEATVPGFFQKNRMPVARCAAIIACLGLLLLSGCRGVCVGDARRAESALAARPDPHGWPGDARGRLFAFVQLQGLNAELLSHDSATATLERWCLMHRLASPARIDAERDLGPELAPTAAQRRELAVSDSELVRHRHVRLKCGTRIVSEADNWYVPARLTPAMNHELTTTNTPFGKVVKPLKFLRHTLEARLLWSPLPENWAIDGIPAGPSLLDVPARVLQHRALLLLPDGTPFSEVVETYTRELLAAPGPAGVH
jgi:hypothetical protein